MPWRPQRGAIPCRSILRIPARSLRRNGVIVVYNLVVAHMF
jgi:hypothetical protein